MTRKKILFGWGRIVFGLLVFSLGIHLTIRAGLGLAPWDCLGMGVAANTPLNYGLSMTAMSILILLADMLMKEKIGFGTILDALLTGNFVQLFNDIDPFPPTVRIWAGVLIIAAGLAFMAVGQSFYMSSGQCRGPRDTLLVALGKRFRCGVVREDPRRPLAPERQYRMGAGGIIGLNRRIGRKPVLRD